MTAEIAIRDEARVIESVVVKGDLSGLSPTELTAYYARMCDALGLTAATQPFALLKLNGKLILYPTRGATDQLAANYRLNREIVDGPKVIDVGGTKMIYAVCRATHPNGRVETAVATVPLNDPLNGLMKAETKAKRRATLSILGLGMLDEAELDTIPASSKVDVRMLTPEELDAAAPAPTPSPVTNAAQAFEDLAKRWGDRIRESTVEDLVEKSERLTRLDSALRPRVLAYYYARWVDLAKADPSIAQQAHARLSGDLRDEVLKAFDKAGIQGAETE